MGYVPINIFVVFMEKVHRALTQCTGLPPPADPEPPTRRRGGAEAPADPSARPASRGPSKGPVLISEVWRVC